MESVAYSRWNEGTKWMKGRSMLHRNWVLKNDLDCQNQSLLVASSTSCEDSASKGKIVDNPI